MRWSRENVYDSIVNAEATAQGVPPALIKAVIGQESAFVPNAKRAEPQIGDASSGLMQLLAKTAKALGYTGTPEGLFDPATNIHYGTKLLSENLSRSNGDIPRAVSAYNGGWRESIGFGRQLPNGQFRNQDYVTRVLANLKYFRDLEAPVASAGPSLQAIAAADKAGAITAALISGALLVILLYMRSRKRG
jgi:soluble lytic murein transglycosylase-like protein